MIANILKRRFASLAVKAIVAGFVAFGMSAGYAYAAPPDVIYIMNDNSYIGTYSPATNSVTNIRNLEAAMTAGDAVPTGTLQNIAELQNGILYFIDTSLELWSWNPATPNTDPVKVGLTTLADQPARLAMDSRGYLVTTSDNTTEIYYLNPATGATISMYALTGAPAGGAGGDLAVAQNGNIYEVTAEQIFIIPPLGGAITTLSTADGASGDVTSLAFDPVTGILYGGVTGTPPSSIYSFNQTTGAATLVSSTLEPSGTINDFASYPTYPDLSVTKTHTGNFTVGTTNTYAITVTNVGSFPTSGTVTVTDTLPTGLTYDASLTSGTGWTCTEATAPTVVCTSTTAIAAGATAPVITLGVNVVGPTGTVNNTVQVTGGGQPIVLPTVIATNPTTILPAAKLTVLKTGPATVAQNGTITYSIVVSNAGPTAAPGTTVTDTVPSNITGVTTTCGSVTGGAVCPTTIAAGNAISTNVPTLPSGGSVTFTVTGTATTTGAITNTATIAPPATVGPATGSTLTSSVNTTIEPLTNLTITKTAPATAALNGLIAYSIVVSNAGPATGSGAVFSDPIPADLTIEGTPSCAVTTGAAVCGAVAVNATTNTVSSTITTLPSGTSVTFTVNVKPTVAQSYTNTATITPPTGSADNDPKTSSATTVVAATTGFTKTVQNITAGTAATGGSNTGKPGDTLQYVLTFTNTTGTTISNFAVSDPTPTNTTFVSAVCGTLPAGISKCTVANPAVGATGTVTYAYTGSLANGEVASFTLNVKIK